MKTAFDFCTFVLFMTVAAVCEAQTANLPTPTPYSIVSRSAGARVWQRSAYAQSPSGQLNQNVQSYTELADGLCFLSNGQWRDSQEIINILPDGSASATNGPCSTYFPIDLDSGVITLVSSEGLQVQFRPVILCYDDGSNTVVLATLTNSVGQLVASNQVIYTNVLSGSIDADVLYTWRKGGFEQDIILHEQPRSAESLGLNAQNAKLEILTEFFDTPQPAITSISVQTAAGETTDENPAFGSIRMVPGKAFLLGANQSGVCVTKQWIQLNGNQFLAESVPLVSIADDLAELPLHAARQRPSHARLRHLVAALPSRVESGGERNGKIVFAKRVSPEKGFRLDFSTVNGTLTDYTFCGDTTYYISGALTLYGTNTFEGGAVLKYANGASIEIEPSAVSDGVIWSAQAGLPVVLTGKDDNSVGQTISGSTGNPSGSYYGNPALNLDLTSDTNGPISNFRIAYAQQAVSVTGSDPPNFYNGQIVNCQNGFNGHGMNTANVENILFANVQTNFNNLYDGNFGVENCTFNCVTNLATIEGSSAGNGLAFTNCIFANVFNLTNNYGGALLTLSAENNGFYNAPVFGSTVFTTSINPFETTGAGSYYLTNGCAFRGVGTTNIDPTLLANLAKETTWPPIVYESTNISWLGTLGPAVQRDLSSSPDLGCHYCPLDYAFGGCDLSNNLAFTAGTAVGWFQASGAVNYGGIHQPYGISLNATATLSFNGTATQPCYFSRFSMMQEGYNGNWTQIAWNTGILFNGNNSSQPPLLSANFTKVTADDSANIFRDTPNAGATAFRNSEIYNGTISTYDMQSLSFTNCLLFRLCQSFWTSPTLSYENCTFYNGGMDLDRSSPVYWLFENCAFDGTGFEGSDSYSGSDETINYNAYNTNNLSWQSYPNNPPYTNKLDIVGANDIITNGFNWESSWFGNFYLPANSSLVDAGSTTADLLGLYHFTTQTSQQIEGTSTVDIGYHYVATDGIGNPLDNNNDSIPDYLEDPDGNGNVDSGEIGWDISADLGLTITISQPPNGSTLP